MTARLLFSVIITPYYYYYSILFVNNLESFMTYNQIIPNRVDVNATIY